MRMEVTRSRGTLTVKSYQLKDLKTLLEERIKPGRPWKDSRDFTTIFVAVRLPENVVEIIDAIVYLSKKEEGGAHSRAEFLRNALSSYLDSWEPKK